MQKKIFYAMIATMVFMAPLSMQSQGNAEEANIKVLLDNLFDGMREGDSAKVALLFRKDASMWTSFTDKDGQRILKRGELEKFLNAIGTPHEEIWDERLFNVKIEVDEDIAQVWADYTFYVGKEFSHCGVDAFHLVKDGDRGWQILHLMDTRRKDNCLELEPK